MLRRYWLSRRAGVRRLAGLLGRLRPHACCLRSSAAEGLVTRSGTGPSASGADQQPGGGLPLVAEVEGRDQPIELNLYVTGYEDNPEPAPSEPGASSASTDGDATTGGDTGPKDKSPTFPGPSESASSESESS